MAETFFLFLREHIHCSALGGLWLLFYYLDKRENDFTIMAGRGNDFTVSLIGTCYGAVTIIHKIAKELTMGYN